MISCEERFRSKVKKTKTCWIWTDSLDRDGYGQFFIYQSQRYIRKRSHRFAWELEKGIIPKGLLVCHKCDVPACVRPSHLFLGTAKENFEDRFKKNRYPTKGNMNPMAKLTNEDIIEIRAKFANGLYQKKIAKQYKITQSNVSCIILKKSWKHI